MAPKKDDIIITALGRISESTDDIHTEMVAMRQDVSLLQNISAKQQGILETHIKRTELAEAAIKHTADEAVKSRDILDGRITPLEAHVSMWAGAGKLFATLISICSIGGLIYKFFM